MSPASTATATFAEGLRVPCRSVWGIGILLAGVRDLNAESDGSRNGGDGEGE